MEARSAVYNAACLARERNSVDQPPHPSRRPSRFMTLSRPKSWPASAARGVALGAVWRVGPCRSPRRRPPIRHRGPNCEENRSRQLQRCLRRLPAIGNQSGRRFAASRRGFSAACRGTAAARPAQQIGRFSRSGDSRSCQEFGGFFGRLQTPAWQTTMPACWSPANLPRASGGQIAPLGDSQAVDATPRDRVRALQLLAAAMPLADADPARADVANLYLDLGHVLLSSRASTPRGSCSRSPISPNCPTMAPLGFSGESMQARGSMPTTHRFYSSPKRWTDAANDGQRWCWAWPSRGIRPGAVERGPLGDGSVPPKPIRRGNVGRLSAAFRCVRRTQSRRGEFIGRRFDLRT